MINIQIKLNTTCSIYKITKGGAKELMNGIFAAFCEKPFAFGTFRECYLGYILDKNKRFIKTSEFPLGKCVVKKNKKDCSLIETVKDFLSSYVSEYFAKEFNNFIKIPNKINFICPYSTFDKISNQFMYVEPFLEGNYTKFSSNTGYENENFRAIIPAFSHYTWIRSKGQTIVVDVQGIFVNNKYYLTDPAIQSIDNQFGGSDLGAMGLMKFVICHKHNDICKNWKWIPNQFIGALNVLNCASIKRTSFAFEHSKNILKYKPLYLALIKKIFG